MWPCWVLIGLYASCAKAFAPAPIRWGAVSSQRFLMAPASMASPTMATVPPQKLTIRDPRGLTSPKVIPRFTAKPDNTISWDAMDWCIEAIGKNSGNAVRFNHCTSEPSQQWNWLPWGLIQLKGTTQCLGVLGAEGSLNGAPIGLRECKLIERESWMFEDPNPFRTDAPPHTFAASWTFRYALISSIAMPMLGTLGLSTWIWRRQRWASTSDVSQGAGYGSQVLILNRHVQAMVPTVMPQNPMPAKDDDQTIPSDVDPSVEFAEGSAIEVLPLDSSSIEKPPLEASHLHESTMPEHVNAVTCHRDDVVLDSALDQKQMLLASGVSTRRGDAASPPEKNSAKQDRKLAKKAAKMAKRLKRRGELLPEGKCCDLCAKKVKLLVRCQIDMTRKWRMVCGKCWKTVSGGVPDGDADHPHYRYGGLWKQR